MHAGEQYERIDKTVQYDNACVMCTEGLPQLVRLPCI